MFTTVNTPRSVRSGLAAGAVIGVLALAGCSGTTDDTDATTDDAGTTSDQTVETTDTADTAEGTDDTSTDDTTGEAAEASDSTYADGTYTAEGSYQTPESVETVSVTVTLEDDIVTAVEVTSDPTNRESEQYQSQFIGSISDEVVGKNIADLNVSRVAGSSLTSGGFNAAIEEIMAEAS